MPRSKTEYIVIHCTATRPSQDVDVRTIDKKRKFKLQFEVLSALIAPNSHPVIDLNIRPIQ